MATIAPWLKAPDVAGEWLRGVQVGQQAAEASARLQEAQQRAAMEAEVQTKQLQQRAVEDAQRIQVSKAYHDAEIGLKQQQLQEIAQQNAQKTRAAAIKLAQQVKFNKVYQDTGDVQRALFESNMGTPSNILGARKDALDLGSQRLDLSRERLAMQEDANASKQNKLAVPRRIGERVTTDPLDKDTKITKYMFEGDEAKNPASNVKRLRWDSGKNALVPVEAAPAESSADDEN